MRKDHLQLHCSPIPLLLQGRGCNPPSKPSRHEGDTPERSGMTPRGLRSTRSTTSYTVWSLHTCPEKCWVSYCKRSNMSPNKYILLWYIIWVVLRQTWWHNWWYWSAGGDHGPEADSQWSDSDWTSQQHRYKRIKSRGHLGPTKKSHNRSCGKTQ